MVNEKKLYKLIILNLILLACYFFIKIPFLVSFFSRIINIIVVPTFLGIFFFYLLKPLNDIFLRKGMKLSRAAVLTLIIALIILSGVSTLLGKYFIREINGLISRLSILAENGQMLRFIDGYVGKYVDIQWIYKRATGEVSGYIYSMLKNIMRVVSYAMNLFSVLLLIIVIVFYFLKDGLKFKESFLRLIPERFKDRTARILVESNKALSSYVTGQAIVALSLAIMIYVGYLIIGMPSALVLSSITFILAFIPFIGFFISMIIPYIIAISADVSIVIKLTILFMVAQALKGRVIVPAVMSKAMHIHPLTDIFLVIGAAALFGPLGAFIAVPIYSVVKVIWINMRILTLR
ncbi:UPF0118 membrane protein YubA [Clostridium polyendosporum]|uniref:UPF0118 membrane protein YubA n=1 Tax=Clostridium polyendosporum TaxID=69208 RepID=A0A919S1J7_9CLOT|nr:AI-2E family transporter [Clostridium polyendosporum]GIM28913.1 UPF0118 membrane protein YubA [Clostridium polyendosporum]